MRRIYTNNQIMILNLDPNFKPVAGEEIQFQSFTFSGGEPHIKIDPNCINNEKVTITHRLNSFDIVVNSEIFAREKNKLLLEISNLNGKVYFSDVINFNQKYSLEIPQDEKLIVYKLSYDGILIEKKKYAR